MAYCYIQLGSRSSRQGVPRPAFFNYTACGDTEVYFIEGGAHPPETETRIDPTPEDEARMRDVA
jgi:hypothetical protein